MTAPYIPPEPTETEAEKWIRRIQAAHQHIITPGDPQAAQAKQDIEVMRGHLLHAIEQERAQNKLIDASEMREAKDMGPGMTFAESAAKGMSWPFGGIAQKLTGSGDTVEASEQSNPLAHLTGEGLGMLATMWGPQKVLKMAREAQLSKATLEGQLLKNAALREGLEDAGEGIAGPTKKATDPLTKRLMDMFHGDEGPMGDTGPSPAPRTPKGPTPKPGEPTGGKTLNRAPNSSPNYPDADMNARPDPYGLDTPPAPKPPMSPEVPPVPPEQLAPHDMLDPWKTLGPKPMSPDEINKMLQDIMKPPKPPFLP